MPATAARASWAAVVRESASSAEIAFALAQAFAPLRFVIAAGGGGFGLLQLGFEAAHLGLERAWVDLEQQVAFLHEGAFGEGHLIDLAGHPWTDLHGFRCFQASGEFVPLVDRLLKHLGHADFAGGMAAACSGVLPHALITATARIARGKRKCLSVCSMRCIRQCI